MTFVQYLSSNPQFGALLGLWLAVVFIGLGVGFILGRAGEEIAFVFGLSAPIRKLMARGFGAFGGVCVGSIAGGVLGGTYGVGPDHLLVGLSSFFGITLGTFLGGLGRSLEEEVQDERALDRFRWVVWRYTSLELESAVALGFGALFGAVCGVVIELTFPMYRGGLRRIMQIGFGGLFGVVLGAAGGSVVTAHARVSRVILGIAVGSVAGACLGLFLVSVGKTHGFLIPGLIFGGVGGACFGLIGGDRVRDPSER